MLNAIIHGKAGRIHIEKDTESLSWRQLYKQREDLLTAAFFSRFTYLSGLIQHRLLKNWLGTGDFTGFKSIEYWPRYDLPDNNNREVVEPDLLLRFEDCDVLVEVKPPQGGTQYQEQWKNEIEGYFAQDDAKVLYFLAIGQVGNTLKNLDLDSIHNQYRLLKVLEAKDWQPIAHQLYQLQKSHQLDAQDSRIVEDMLQSLELYGIRAYELKWSHIKKLYSEQLLDMNAIGAWV